MGPKARQENLFAAIEALGSCVVAFSGGLDSTFLLWAARKTLADRVIAATLATPYTPGWELREAKQTAGELGVEHLLIMVPEVPEEIRFNPDNRCYLCKKRLFSLIAAEAARRGVHHVIDGTNADDAGDYRPGLRALRELNVKSPLLECGITKEDIRLLSRDAGLPAWQKTPCACLLTRIPHGREITQDELVRIELSEQYLRDRGFETVRVRSHGDLARIELSRQETKRVFADDYADNISRALRGYGYCYVSMELSGYRTGSMNSKPEDRGEE